MISPTLVLLAIYVVVIITLQVVSFFISQMIGYFNPAISLMTFLVLFMAMFWVAWPVAYRVTAWLIPETERERAARIART